MTEYEIRISEPAEADIESAFEYLFLRDVAYAERWHEGLIEAINSLRTMPHRCSIAPDNHRYDHEVRQLWYGKRRSAYRILYTVFEDPSDPYVWILRVRHHAQQLLGEPDEE